MKTKACKNHNSVVKKKNQLWNMKMTVEVFIIGDWNKFQYPLKNDETGSPIEN